MTTQEIQARIALQEAEEEQLGQWLLISGIVINLVIVVVLWEWM